MTGYLLDTNIVSEIRKRERSGQFRPSLLPALYQRGYSAEVAALKENIELIDAGACIGAGKQPLAVFETAHGDGALEFEVLLGLEVAVAVAPQAFELAIDRFDNVGGRERGLQEVGFERPGDRAALHRRPFKPRVILEILQGPAYSKTAWIYSLPSDFYYSDMLKDLYKDFLSDLSAHSAAIAAHTREAQPADG